MVGLDLEFDAKTNFFSSSFILEWNEVDGRFFVIIPKVVLNPQV